MQNKSIAIIGGVSAAIAAMAVFALTAGGSGSGLTADGGQQMQSDNASSAIRVTTTTNMITDLLKNIGGDRVVVTGIMGTGVDPHLYRATASDIDKLRSADIIFYNGLELEGKMGDVFVQISRTGKPVYAISEQIDPSVLLETDIGYDPHIWWDATLWMDAARVVAGALSELDPEHSDIYQENMARYIAELQELHDFAISEFQTIPETQRVLVTAHDAFQYFGRAYGVEVLAIQGWSTESEAGISEIRNLADIVAARQIKAIFVETTISPSTIQALREAVRDRNHNVVIGGELFSDSIGSPDTGEGTYIGAFRYNVQTIVGALR